jgi:hypothetical protein
VLAGRFPAITSLEFKLVSNHAWNAMTDEGMRAVCSLTALTSLDLAWCVLVSDEGLRSVSSLTGGAAEHAVAPQPHAAIELCRERGGR